MFVPHVKFLYPPPTAPRRREPGAQLLGQGEGEERKQISDRLLISPTSEVAMLQGFKECHAIHPQPLL